MSLPKFIPGLELSELFFEDAVKPILNAYFPRLEYSAGLLGPGSEVLGFDTPISADHNWGPRVQLFLGPDDCERSGQAIAETLANELPHSYQGYSVNFSQPDVEDGGTRAMETRTEGPVNHKVEVTTVEAFFGKALGLDSLSSIPLLAWLTFPEQTLLEVTAGRVFLDGLDQLCEVRQKLTYYPHDIWLYRMACQWKRISEEEAFVGRCGDIGDELGSSIVAARIVRDLMRLAFLMERRYAPYSKWLGTAFAQLGCAERLRPVLWSVMRAEKWRDREKHLCQAYVMLSTMHNGLNITNPLDREPTNYFERPYRVIFAARFAEEIRQSISDPSVRSIGLDIGGVDQWIDCVELTAGDSNLLRRMEWMYKR